MSISVPVPKAVHEASLWASLLAVICAIDAWAIRSGRPTLSQGHGDAVTKPLGRVIIGTLEAVLLCHLWRFPRRLARFDPIAAAARLVPTKQQAKEAR